MNAQEYTIYEVATKRIYYTTVTVVDSIEDIAVPAGYAAAPGRFAASDYYIEDGIPVGRHDLPRTLTKLDIVANGVDAAIIEGLPVGTQVTIGTNLPVTVDDGAFEFTTDLPGAYIVRFDHAEYLPEEVTINAS